jgi:hypothetical protein
MILNWRIGGYLFHLFTFFVEIDLEHPEMTKHGVYLPAWSIEVVS